MLALPEKGFRRSITAHNVDPVICCDWLEACALFEGTEVTGSDVVDLLREQEIYAEQDFAWELVGDSLSRLKERKRLLGEGYPFDFQPSRILPRSGWRDYPAYSFCLALSLASAYPNWSRTGADYGKQGRLFEALTAESVKLSLPGWDVHATGCLATRRKSSKRW